MHWPPTELVLVLLITFAKSSIYFLCYASDVWLDKQIKYQLKVGSSNRFPSLEKKKKKKKNSKKKETIVICNICSVLV